MIQKRAIDAFGWSGTSIEKPFIVIPKIDGSGNLPHGFVGDAFSNVLFRGGYIKNPTGENPAGKDDRVAHCIQLRHSRSCTIYKTKFTGGGDQASLFNCWNCAIDAATFIGKLLACEWEVIIDGPDGRNCTLRNMTLRKGIGIFGGVGHRIENVTCHVIQLNTENSKVKTEVTLDRVQCDEVYVGRNAGVVEYIGCEPWRGGVRLTKRKGRVTR